MMANKRRAPEDLAAMEGVVSPAPKRRRSREPEDEPPANGTAAAIGASGSAAEAAATAERGPGSRPREADADLNGGAKDDDEDDGDEDDDSNDAARRARPTRPAVAAPAAGYDGLYLDTINRQVLDFDFEKLCSVSLSNINVYACLVCGRYYQGRGLRSHAYFHALDEDHHVFINMQTQRVYVLPEGYEVLSRSLDDIKFVADPRYTRADVARLDRWGARALSAASAAGGDGGSYTLSGKPYTPGFVGMNNIKENDYLNVVVQALAHVPPLRNFFLLDEFAAKLGASSAPSASSTTPQGAPASTAAAAASAGNPNVELVKRFGLLVRKIWNPRAFKAHVSPHELLQAVALRSNRRFTLTAQSDPVDFLTWFLNHLHLGLGGSRTRPGSSIVQRVFQGRLRVESEKLEAVGAAAAAAKAAEQEQQQQARALQQLQEHQNQVLGQVAGGDAMQIDSALPARPAFFAPPPPPPGPPGVPGSFMSPFQSQQQQQQQLPPGVSRAPSALAPPPGPPGLTSPLPPPPPPSSAADAKTQQKQQQEDQTSPSAALSAVPPPLPPKGADVSRFLLLTLDLPATPLFQDEQERNIIPQVPLTTLLAKYDGTSAHDQGDVRRRYRLQRPLPPYLVLHMKRFSANKFVTERNPTIVTFAPRGLDMAPFVEAPADGHDDGEELLYDLVANVVHEAVRAHGDDVAESTAEERRTWKVQLRDRGAGAEDRWVVAQDLFVEPVASELLYLAESYIQIWERRQPHRGGDHGKGKAANSTTAKANP